MPSSGSYKARRNIYMYQLPVRSSLVTSGSAVHNSYQLRADIALTDPERLNKGSQLSRGSFAASVWDVFKLEEVVTLVTT